MPCVQLPCDLVLVELINSILSREDHSVVVMANLELWKKEKGLYLLLPMVNRGRGIERRFLYFLHGSTEAERLMRMSLWWYRLES